MPEPQRQKGWQPESTVIVLPQEHLLFSVLHALPEGIEQVNVTMGYPLRNTPLYHLIEQLLDMQQHARKYKDGRVRFHYRNVLALLRHPYLYYPTTEQSDFNIAEIEQRNKIYIDFEEDGLQKDQHFYPLIFQRIEEGPALITYLMEVLRLLYDTLSYTDEDAAEEPETEATEPERQAAADQADNTDQAADQGLPFEQECIYQFYTQLQRLQEVLVGQGLAAEGQPKVELTLATFLKLFRQLIKNLRLPFTGEPLSGLQIMGLFETRNLDFQHVIILSMNEGAWPPETNPHSFIPYNLRKGFGLPVADQQEALYSYLFYRLLQRAQNVHVLYNTEDTGRLNGEMSRYLQQIKYTSPLPLHQQVLANSIQLQPPPVISIDKSPAVMESLLQYTNAHTARQKWLTPSAINLFLYCKLRFYYRYVALLYEAEAVQEEIDAPLFGNLLHYALEHLYDTYIKEVNKGNRTIAKEDFPELKNRLMASIQAAFKKEYGIPPNREYVYEGRNVIARDIIRKVAARIINHDQSQAPFTIIGLEADKEDGYYHHFPISTSAGKYTVALRGIIDRIDEKDGTVRVIDYKTGKDDKVFTTIESLFDANDPARNKAAMQTLLYGMLYIRDAEAKDGPVMPGLYNYKDLFGQRFDLMLQQKDGSKLQPLLDMRPLLPQFEAGLRQLLQQVFDPAQPFTQTTDLRKCSYCPYANLCHRD